MEEPLFHVLLQGQQVGPYDRRTIVGMRIKKALTSEHELVGTDGSRLTVADLIRRAPAEPFSPQRTSAHSIVQATYPGSLAGVHGAGMPIPAFRGEVEIRVQPDVLRIAGRHREGLGWKDSRVKLPVQDIAETKVQGSEVELGVRHEGRPALQRVRLELFTPQAAGELVAWLPNARAPQAASTSRAVGAPPMMWASVAGVTLAVFIVIGVMLARRVY
ncbi:hypothetical protein [Ramlibacter humi]|uniref:Uncharacterized protein n=1 Tax=Ramlibacter humi TaxID=2530451 RepID=A0A4Z0CAH9_9BURK|nr:hypothetical protein [Ramlibacter humi]TFZ08667.1 hypothetical protein EZ216_05800 [Ramlibacter humi]